MQKRDEDLLLDLFGHGVLTRAQIMLLGHFGSVQRCNSRLLRLRQHGFIQVVRHPAAGGASPALYRVGRQAAKHLTVRLGITLTEFQRAASSSAAVTFMEHTAKLVELRLAFEKALRGAAIEQWSWHSEALCRHVYSVSGQRRVVKPDSFVYWQNGGVTESWFVELDLGNASQIAICSKLASYGSYLNDGAYHEVYGQESFGVLIVTTGQQRLQNLLRQCPPLPFPVLGTVSAVLQSAGPLSPIWSCPVSLCWPSTLLRRSQ
ncbi:MAG: replication-relaxation family protein [Fimbriimonadaceae bacterium]|nr:replication-relaxation family protein [Fimbriimonadaceae bacterium]QYK59117.1 MAG: replication-relaxation family protein [Fimbriimonadaceae bacterium]